MIAEALRHGAKNGMRMSELTTMFDCSDRDIRLQVHRERIAGAVILAGNDGFYLPSEDPDTALQEIKGFERRMYAKAHNTIAATESATRERQRLTGSTPPPSFFSQTSGGTERAASTPEKYPRAHVKGPL